MGKGYIEIDTTVVASWFFLGKRAEDIKELLQLPDSFEIVNVLLGYDPAHALSIIVSSEAIPDIPLHNQIQVFGSSYNKSPDEIRVDAKIELQRYHEKDKRVIKVKPFSFEIKEGDLNEQPTNDL